MKILTVFKLNILLRQEPSRAELGCQTVSDLVLHKIREVTVRPLVIVDI